MPRYFFHVHDGGHYVDDVGQDMLDDGAVRSEAMKALPAIARDEIPKDGDKQGYMVLATDEDGKPVYSATLTFAGVWLNGSQGVSGS